ncbi:unnamed protein product [Thelazia callipaeda]|uniref:C2H2-type domain-containing protein n=1 Tax=Thelazia callipaeda TaxID=103827 RepID=A0A0N5CQN3_THECL|nr:unnamed protein product [Thelazia callipaeda]
MLTNDEKQHQDNASLSASPSQQTQLSLPQYSQTDNGANILVTTQSALNTDFLDCMTRNLLATTVAGISEQQPPVSAATAAAVAAVATAAAFGLSVPDVSMMYNHVNLNHLFNLNLLTQSQQSQQLPQSSSLSSPSSSFLMEYLRQRTLAEANTQQPQQLHLKLQQQQQQQQQQRSQHHHHNQQQQQRQRQQRPSKEKKRSYPCSFQWCELCMREVHSSKLPCHIRQHHVAQPMFICPQCKFSSSYSKNNVKSHMSTVHGLTEEPISHMEEYADEVEQLMKKCFPTVRGRGRPMHAGNTRPSTASSSSSFQAESNSNSRRSSASSVISASSTAGRYTHSHRRRGSKYPAQETAQDLLSITYSKRVKRHELSKEIPFHCSESELASTETRVDASGQSSPSEEDSAANVSGMHSSANEKSYTKSGKETSSYRNGIANFDGNDEITDGYTDGIDSYHTENTNLHDKNEQNETVANDNSPSSSEHVSNDAELGMY